MLNGCFFLNHSARLDYYIACFTRPWSAFGRKIGRASVHYVPQSLISWLYHSAVFSSFWSMRPVGLHLFFKSWLWWIFWKLFQVHKWRHARGFGWKWLKIFFLENEDLRGLWDTLGHGTCPRCQTNRPQVNPAESSIRDHVILGLMSPEKLHVLEFREK